MSLSASMWTGVSGLLTHGDRMNVIGNNIANVNTVGFKSQRMDFADFIYHDSFSLSGPTQIGCGVRIGAVLGEFSQGSSESSTEATDLAIGGTGFFKVKPIGSDAAYYTRAGNFRFDKTGYLTDPNGYAVQGWKLDPTTGSTQGAITDVKLDQWSIDPAQTTKISMQVNLSKEQAVDKANIAGSAAVPAVVDPVTGATITPAQPAVPARTFASLVSKWNGAQYDLDPTTDLPKTDPTTGAFSPITDKTYIAEDSYCYQTSMDAYDEAGGTHTVTVYFDKINPENYVEGNNGQSMWEYIVTMNPEEDLRQVATVENGTTTQRSIRETKAAGLLMSGTLTFDGPGHLANQSAYTIQGARGIDVQGAFYQATANDAYVPIIDDATDIAKSLYPTSVSEAGYPVTVANFTGVPGAQTVGSTTNYQIEMNFGLKLDSENPWGDPASVAASSPLSNTYINPPQKASTATLAEAPTNSVTRQPNSFTSYKGSYHTQSITQNGYGYGTLSNYTVDTDGILHGIYSNGENVPLYQLTLYDFTSKQGLRREGNNLFSQTSDSGQASSGVAGTGLFGTVNSYSLEGSNVDLSTEFVRMITTQRGFQSNSKVVTTTDTMLETVINMKRM